MDRASTALRNLASHRRRRNHRARQNGFADPAHAGSAAMLAALQREDSTAGADCLYWGSASAGIELTCPQVRHL